MSIIRVKGTMAERFKRNWAFGMEPPFTAKLIELKNGKWHYIKTKK